MWVGCFQWWFHGVDYRTLKSSFLYAILPGRRSEEQRQFPPIWAGSAGFTRALDACSRDQEQPIMPVA